MEEQQEGEEAAAGVVAVQDHLARDHALEHVLDPGGDLGHAPGLSNSAIIQLNHFSFEFNVERDR